MSGKKGTALTAREILRREYGSSRNLMTPHVLRVGKIDRETAYELSSGAGFDPGSTVYGVSIARVLPDGSTERDYDASACFSHPIAALRHVVSLRVGASA
jgi:hypothetical protein